MKTAKEIQTDIYNFLRGSKFAQGVNGDVYRQGYRPRNSAKEDIIVIFTTGAVGEVQRGVVTINAYVPDIDPYRNGVFVEDGRRTAEVETLAKNWVESLTAAKSDYLFNLNNTIYTEADAEVPQHFIVVRLNYKLYQN